MYVDYGFKLIRNSVDKDWSLKEHLAKGKIMKKTRQEINVQVPLKATSCIMKNKLMV